MKRVPNNVKVIGGPFYFKDNRFIDITKNKEFIKKSIIPAVEEIIKLIITNSDITIFASKVQVIGNGLLPELLVEKLALLGSKVVGDKPDTIINCDSNLDILKRSIKDANRKTLILDVSNSDKIIDKRVIKARGLAVKSAPRTIAKILFESLKELYIIKPC